MLSALEQWGLQGIEYSSWKGPMMFILSNLLPTSGLTKSYSQAGQPLEQPGLGESVPLMAGSGTR